MVACRGPYMTWGPWAVPSLFIAIAMEPPPLSSVISVFRTLVSIVSSVLFISWARVSPSQSGTGASVPSSLVCVLIILFSCRAPGFFMSISLVSWVFPLVSIIVLRSVCIIYSLVSSRFFPSTITSVRS